MLSCLQAKQDQEMEAVLNAGAWWSKRAKPATECGGELCPLLALPFERPNDEDGFLQPLKDPPPPQPLLFLPLQVGDVTVRALLDSGASDSFVSYEVVRALGLTPYPLQQPLTVRVANGQGLAVTHFVKLQGKLGPMNVRLLLRMIKTNIPVVLGYPFLARLQPLVDWKRRVIRVERKDRVYEIPALPAADSYRITCPVVGDGSLNATPPTESSVEVLSEEGEAVVNAITGPAVTVAVEEVTPPQKIERPWSDQSSPDGRPGAG